MATDQKLPQLAFINKRLKEVKVQQRKDVNIMCSWAVTLPQGMDKEEKRFFEATFQFLSERYGKALTSAATRANRICTSQKEKAAESIRKEILNRQELQRFYEDLEKYVRRVSAPIRR